MSANLILVCGSRHWADYQRIIERLSQEPAGTVVIEGGAEGADRLAYRAAMSLGFNRITVKALWAKYGRSAGPRRNRAMLDLKPCKVIAFTPDLAKSIGTKDCVEEAQRRGIPVEVHNS